MTSLAQDLRYAVRALMSRPVYALVTTLVLIAAIGANTTMFSLLNAYVLRPLPYPDSDRLVAIYNIYPNMGLESAAVSIPDYIDRRDQAPSLASVAIYNSNQRLLGGADRPEQVQVTTTTPSLFDVLGVDSAVGRVFAEDEAILGQESVAILSHRLWTTRFGAEPGLVGRDILLDDKVLTVVGIMPESFGFPSEAVDIWLPFAFTPEQMSDAERGNEFSRSVGRLAAGATIAGLNAEMDAIVQRSLDRLQARRPFLESTGFTGRAENLQDLMVGDVRVLLYLLQGLVLAVLLIACANIANLQLARTATRRKELSVRAALGASQGRLARLVLTESFILSLIGSFGGLVICYAAVGSIDDLIPVAQSPGSRISVDTTVLMFSLAAALLATIATGLFPLAAMRREQLAQVVQDSSRIGGGLAAQKFRGGLVVFQIAASVALLVSAGLLAKSFSQLTEADPGFDSEGVWTAGTVLPRGRYSDHDARVNFYTEAFAALVALPGVTEAGFTSTAPFSGSNSEGSYAIDGFAPLDAGALPHAQHRSISEGYLPAMGVATIQGRNFLASESERVAIVDELFVRRYFPDGNALGQRISTDDADSFQWSTIVGVVPALTHDTLAVSPSKETIYWHYGQRPFGGGQIVLRTLLPAEQLTPVVTATIAEIDRDILLADAMTMETRILLSLGPQGVAMQLTLIFAVGAVFLAVIGIYGVLTWSVTQRVGEIGVRMALGAQSADIVRMIVRQGGRYIGLGLALGLCLALAVGFGISSQVYQVSPADPAVFALAIAGILFAALVASWLPARRAAGVDPMNALRNQ
jgi:predicted permease